MFNLVVFEEIHVWKSYYQIGILIALVVYLSLLVQVLDLFVRPMFFEETSCSFSC